LISYYHSYVVEEVFFVLFYLEYLLMMGKLYYLIAYFE